MKHDYTQHDLETLAEMHHIAAAESTEIQAFTNSHTNLPNSVLMALNERVEEIEDHIHAITQAISKKR